MRHARLSCVVAAALSGCASENVVEEMQCVFEPAAEAEAPPADWKPLGSHFVLCPYTFSEVVCAPRTPEALFTSDELRYMNTMAWTGDGLAIGVVLQQDAGVDRQWGVAATKGATAEVTTLWELPVENFPSALLPTHEGLFVVAKSYSSAVTGGLLRLLPDGSHEQLFVTPYSGLNYDPEHPFVFADGRIHGLMRDTPLGWETRPTRIAAAGGELEVFDFATRHYALVDGEFIGLSGNLGSPPCDHGADCFSPLLSLALRRHDPASGTTSTIQPAICITANPGYTPERYWTRPFRGLGVHASGFVVDDGALVDIGFDGSHRVIAALADGFAQATLHGEWIYFVSSQKTPEGRSQALRRVALQGGPIEELARFPGASLTIGTFDGEHVYLDHYTEEGSTLMRVPL
ncbi:hypothetical protein [Polyangium sorediatum]|uniref:Lipoprotein n=1 Tax=Polyangium sorediatum TaxID=889274 RepID=A0ABT6P0L2_9BACT|nr:hypothetical protein [Polyangium sorediatum]MDI1434056.1 hypothetical protein [Polyangium sorediatum]